MNRITASTYYNGQAVLWLWRDQNLLSGSCIEKCSIAADALPVRTLDFSVIVQNAAGAQRIINHFPRGQAISYYSELDRRVRFNFYVDTVEWESRNAVTFHCIDALGRLSYKNHYGGFYADESAGVIIADLLSGISYTIEPDIYSFPVKNGWLPIDSARNNLRQVLLAAGASALLNSSGHLHIGYVDAATPLSIADSRVALGGKVTKSAAISRLDVTCHEYQELQTDEEIVLYSNADSGLTADHLTVTFSDPCHDITWTGATLHESNANYAVVSGVGTLTGKKYTHHETVYSKGSSGSNTASVRDATLVNYLNVENVAERLYRYYSADRLLECEIVQGTETLGDAVSVKDPFGEVQSGYIEGMEIEMSGHNLARIQVISGLTPGPYGPTYTDYEIIDEDGTWTPPANLDGGIHVVLIGGGQGGQGGAGGSGGQGGAIGAPGEAGAGGSPGEGGAAGRILRQTIAAADVAASYSVTIGAGGQGGSGGSGGAGGAGGYISPFGGNVDPGDGSPGLVGSAGGLGGNTTFGSLSSANGAVHSNGFSNLISGDRYAEGGGQGIYSGAAGGNGGITTGLADPGGNVETYEGGQGGAYYSVTSSFATGGGGGGAAYGAGGGDGEDGTAGRTTGGRGGAGGSGGDAVLGTMPSLSYGSGGYGGNGGGGGGGGGGAQGIEGSRGGEGGTGGAGSSGQNGAAGAVIVFYKLAS